jgi:hypothetical protein
MMTLIRAAAIYSVTCTSDTVKVSASPGVRLIPSRAHERAMNNT